MNRKEERDDSEARNTRRRDRARIRRPGRRARGLAQLDPGQPIELASDVDARKNDADDDRAVAVEDDDGDGDDTRGDDGTNGGNNTGDGDNTAGNDGTSGGDNTGGGGGGTDTGGGGTGGGDT